MNFGLNIKCQFWKKDTPSLFDYESSDKIASEVSTTSSCLLSHENKMIKLIKEDSISNFSGKIPNYLISVNAKTNPAESEYKLKIAEDFYTKEDSDNWVVIRHSVMEDKFGYELKADSIIKLGRVVFKVLDVAIVEDGEIDSSPNTLNTQNQDENAENEENMPIGLDDDFLEMEENEIQNSNFTHMDIRNSDMNYNTNRDHQNNLGQALNLTSISDRVKSKQEQSGTLTHRTVKSKMGKNNICRICLGDNSDGKLVNICNCTGSVKYIHTSCLQKWLISKTTIRSHNHLTVYTYKNIECELCKTKIPGKIKLRDKILNLLSPEAIIKSSSGKLSSYLALECVKNKSNIDKSSEKKTVYIINLKNKNLLTMGRALDTDVRMTDISISRNHAVIAIDKGRMFINDNSSKFGTHVNLSLNKEIDLLKYKQITLQCGRFCLSFNLYRTCLSYLCCRGKVDNKDKVDCINYSEVINRDLNSYLLSDNSEDKVKVAEYEEEVYKVSKFASNNKMIEVGLDQDIKTININPSRNKIRNNNLIYLTATKNATSTVVFDQLPNQPENQSDN